MSLTSQQNCRVEELFEKAGGLPAEQRAGFLDRFCADDPAVRQEVDALLHYRDSDPTHSRGQPILERAASPSCLYATATHTPADRVERDDLTGQRIGSYLLRERIGEGGFGEVYMAEQDEPFRRRVAMKIVKLGMDTRQVLARFEAERQALAMMEHENIARVVDAGATNTGRPYFVMELVSGVPVTQYCDDHRLTIYERLELFSQVCQAVEHAHQKSVIHRDLKPSNVLVSTVAGEPLAKVIDFGIAKLLDRTSTGNSLLTEINQMIGTPAYMSPEQAGATPDIDTRTDVYSLGVLLYELLTGTPTFDARSLRAAALEEVRRIIREVDPPSPSTRVSSLSRESNPRIRANVNALPEVRAPKDKPYNVGSLQAVSNHARSQPNNQRPIQLPALTPRGDLISADIAQARRTNPQRLARSIRGELDWIVMKCLEKDRARRYESASALASDIRCHITSDAVAAAPPSATYRLRKFVRRNRGIVATAILVIMTLFMGLLGMAWQARRADVSRKKAEIEAYVANLIAADASLLAHEPARLRARLDACPADLRGWEWGYLFAQSNTSSRIVCREITPITCAVLSPDGCSIATVSDKSARLWDVDDGHVLANLEGVGGSLSAIAFSSDGSRLVTASTDGTACIWDTDGNQEVLLSGHREPITAACFDFYGTRVLTSSMDQTVRIWDSKTGNELMRLSDGFDYTFDITISSDGTRILTCSTGRAVVWDAESGRALKLLNVGATYVYAGVFTCDNKQVLLGCSDSTVRIVDVLTGELRLVLSGHRDDITSVAVSSNGLYAVTGSRDRTARVWEVATGDTLAVLRGHGAQITSVAFAPDSAHIVTASDDCSVLLWDTPIQPVFPPSQSYVVFSLDISPDASCFVTSSVNKTASVWNLSTNSELNLIGHNDKVIAANYSPDGKRVVTASLDKTARLWDAVLGEEQLVLLGHEGTVASAVFSPDGKRVLTASEDRTARVWDVTGDDGICFRALEHPDRVYSARFDGRGERIVSACGILAYVWGPTDGEAPLVLTGHDGTVNAAVFSPDGTRIATASCDKTARVWDAVLGRELFALIGHEAFVLSAVYTHKDSRIVTTSSDGTARIWDADSGKELAILRTTHALTSATVSPDGTCIYTASWGTGIQTWDSIPYVVRKKQERAVGVDRSGGEIVRTWLRDVCGRNSWE